MLKVIEWRNEIVHKSGRLPSGPTAEFLHEHVTAVMNLVSLLAERSTNIEANPELEPIKRSLLEIGDLIWPMIWLEDRHHVRIDVTFFHEEADTLGSKMQETIGRASELLRARDARFDPAKHLTIHFMALPKRSLAWYRHGELTASRSPAPPAGTDMGTPTAGPDAQ